jgi:hypothetical protein
MGVRSNSVYIFLNQDNSGIAPECFTDVLSIIHFVNGACLTVMTAIYYGRDYRLFVPGNHLEKLKLNIFLYAVVIYIHQIKVFAWVVEKSNHDGLNG